MTRWLRSTIPGLKVIKNQIRCVLLGATVCLPFYAIIGQSNIAQADSIKAVINIKECDTGEFYNQDSCILDKALQRHGDGLRVCRDHMNERFPHREWIERHLKPDDSNLGGQISFDEDEGNAVRTLGIYWVDEDIDWAAEGFPGWEPFLGTINLCNTAGTSPQGDSPKIVYDAARLGATKYPEDCNKSVRAAGNELGVYIPENYNADDIIGYLRENHENWRRLSSMHDASLLAKEGKFVIAAATSSSINNYYINNRIRRTAKHGHLAVVSPYTPAPQVYEGIEYPWVIGGALNNPDASSELSKYRIDGQVPIRRAFPKGMINNNGVEFFTPSYWLVIKML